MTLELSNVSITLGGRQLVKGLDLKLAPGEVVGLLGPLDIRGRSITRPRRSQEPGAPESEDPKTSPRPSVRQERFVA
jgi:hypothetical protein